ncbi:MAG: hypothetical protein PVI06_03330 [Desulfobacterales bacterium]|jgi:hypothetical protein
MTDHHKNQNTIKQVKQIYVAVFPVPIGDDFEAETVLAGCLTDPENPYTYCVQATVETDFGGLPALVKMCDEILRLQPEIKSYRLLKFDHAGVHELDPNDFRAVAQVTLQQAPGHTWGVH